MQLMQVFFTCLSILFFAVSVFGQQKSDIPVYIQQYKHIAMEEMVRTKIPASITMAQGILESGCGKSPLSKQANNHFGIKCKADWKGKQYFQDDDEKNECFRVYEHAEASYVDHSDFLLTRFRYAELFELASTDYKGWAKGLKALGYATNPNYANILIGYIETYKLHELDLMALAQIEEKEKLLAHGAHAVATNANPVETVVIRDAPKENVIASLETTPSKKGREEITVNGLRAVKAMSNEDPLQVAFEFNIDYAFVLAYNDLANGEKFKTGEYIYLQQKKSHGEDASYTVKPGETMRDIAQRQGIRLRDLYSKNLMKMNDQPYAGETLALRDNRREPLRTMTYYEYLRAQRPDADKEIRMANKNSEYQVQQSDTLYSIAKKFNTTVEELQKLNNLASAEVKAGQTLVVLQ